MTTDFEVIARRYGCGLAPTGALVVNGCRVATWGSTGLLCVTTDNEAAAAAIVRSGFCGVVYRAGYGRVTATFNPRRIGELIALLSPDEMPSYGRSRGYRS